MISLNIDQLLQAQKIVRSKKTEVLAAADRQYRSKILAMYKEILLVAPQFSGDFVSNFDIETTINHKGKGSSHSPSRGYTPIAGKGSVAVSQQPLNAGDTGTAYQSAYMRGVGRLRFVKHGQPVFFVNPTPITIDSPEVIGPAGDRRDLRDSMVITAWESIHSYLQAKYGSTS